ncbi:MULTISPECIES: hypothetical protein [Methylomonas]|jgi:hypothetical protein|uniref:Lipoprotein n=1 Tax=Methylomonas methanica TaxID=421 RepID=A0A177MNF2_METMH|nr:MULTISPECIES: hypothetical protein [Methylomonas]OAI06955.1 hypothetical protein A1353_07905 [Methylomonas methanica]PKM13713.1 MAG: hypothetical protein CVV13_00510 [Gammaproteobacteria bacterium HGW-Gammaproteobacteria-3]QBC26593.1 hypothetical protein U737_06520 [Methylomonas sp. LW13]
MKTITKLLVVTSLTLGVLSGCQQNPHPMDMSAAIQSAKTKDDHESLATHFEQNAKDAEVKVEEHKKLLQQYKQHSYLYGKQSEMFFEHCQSLINSYQKAVDANTAMAKMHHQMAGDK